ncbi:MAG: HAMP domain-containing sensor histidine kinase [Lachnospiraceae bacterium]|nr:HAMP domain-containing sensor histidine kinase [Lachnospiraceae bacterium]
MKNSRYSTGMKALLVMLQQVFAVLLVVSIVLLSSLFGKQMLDTDDILNRSFVDSGYYAETFQHAVEELIQYAYLKEQFEVQGAYNEDKVIDIFTYVSANGVIEMRREPVKIPEQKFKYRVGDLLTWAENGYSEGEDGLLVEAYTPIAGKSVHQCLKEGLLSYEDAHYVLERMEQILANIKQDMKLYQRFLNKYSVSETNVHFWISGGHEIPHVSSNVGYSDVRNELKNSKNGTGSYFYYDAESLHMKTNVDGMEDYFYNHLERLSKNIGAHPKIMIFVDTNLPNQDSFAEANREYQRYHPWILGGIFLLAFSVLAFIVTLVLLTNMAGRVDGESDVIRTNWVDRIKTEIIIFAILMLIVATTISAVQIMYDDWEIPGMLIISGAMTYVCDSIFLVLYLSIVRRMKAGILWKNSLIYWVYHGVVKVFFHWKVSARTLIIFVGGNLVFLFTTYQMLVNHSVIAAIVWIGLLMADAIITMKKAIQRNKMMDGVEEIAGGNLKYKIDTEGFYAGDKVLAEAINNIGDGLYRAVDENTKNERMKADLITNVSHDIKTPLTSIINYVNLIKMEKVENEKVKEYVNILDAKAQRLRQLTEDLVEASKISSGNIELNMQCIDFVELIYQTGGEFNEKFEAKDLTTITKLPGDPVYIMADGRRIWRVVENLYNNVAKYALAHTRVYVTVETTEDEMEFSVKNISEQELKLDTEELTERFIRGDTSRTTEGSGLGLSIAKNLTILMNGHFFVGLDGDLFKVSVRFPLASKKETDNLAR